MVRRDSAVIKRGNTIGRENEWDEKRDLSTFADSISIVPFPQSSPSLFEWLSTWLASPDTSTCSFDAPNEHQTSLNSGITSQTWWPISSVHHNQTLNFPCPLWALFSVLPAPPLPSRFVVLFPTNLCECISSPPLCTCARKTEENWARATFTGLFFISMTQRYFWGWNVVNLPFLSLLVAARRRNEEAFCLLTTSTCTCSRPE